MMTVTLPCDGGYSSIFRLSTYFELCGRGKMQTDECDLLEVLIFDEIEETSGSWLRAIIQRLEKEQTVMVLFSSVLELDKKPQSGKPN
jgi:hypothetical protein